MAALKRWLGPFWLAALLLLSACHGTGDSLSLALGTEGNRSPAGGSSSESSEEVREIIILARNFAFDQDVYTVSKGERVKIVFENVEGYHEAIIEGYDIKLKAGEPVIFVADESGEFELYCTLVCGPIEAHQAMRAKFVVEE